MPISTTSTSASSGVARIVVGRPWSLLKLRSLACTRTARADRGDREVLGARLADAAGDRRPPARRTARARSTRARSISARSVSSTSIAVPSAGRARGEVRAGAAAERIGDELVAVALGDQRDEQLTGQHRTGVERHAVELDVGPDQATAGGRCHLDCPEPHGATRYRRLEVGRSERIHLVVLFGGRSAEHDVSCTSATHVLRAVDPTSLPDHPDRHRPRRRVGAGHRRGQGARRRARRAARPPRHRRRAGLARPRCSATPATGPPSCCRSSTARWARTARSRDCWSWPTSPTSAPACSARRWAWTRRWPSRCSPPTASPRPATSPCARTS